MGRPAVAIPEFGYYAGPAASITALDHGRVIHARLARWSVNPRIVVFWFIPPAAPAGATLTGLGAYDAAGHQLPAGSGAPGNGWPGRLSVAAGTLSAGKLVHDGEEREQDRRH